MNNETTLDLMRLVSPEAIQEWQDMLRGDFFEENQDKELVRNYMQRSVDEMVADFTLEFRATIYAMICLYKQNFEKHDTGEMDHESMEKKIDALQFSYRK